MSTVGVDIIRPPCCLQIFRFFGNSEAARREISLPPGGRWILRSKRRKEPARVLFSSYQRLQNKATRTLLQSPTAPALVATRSLLGSDSPPDCHSIPRSRFATSRREPSRVRPKIIRPPYLLRFLVFREVAKHKIQADEQCSSLQRFASRRGLGLGHRNTP